jgi:Tfp pilus assembly protein PilO
MQTLRVSMFTVYHVNSSQVSMEASSHHGLGTYFDIVNFSPSLGEIPYRILDLEKLALSANEDGSRLTMLIAYTCMVEGSYSNRLYIQNLTLDVQTRKVLAKTETEKISASMINWNTFKITKLHLIP